MRFKKSASISMRIQSSFFILIACILGMTTAYSVISDIKASQQGLDGSISDYAYLLANDDNVRSMLLHGVPDDKTIAYLDEALLELRYVDMLVVADVNSIRLYHPEKFRIGQLYVGGDQYKILQGAKPYIEEALGTIQHQRRAYHAVHDDYGNIIGFVMVSAYSVHIRNMQIEIILEGVFFFALALLIGSILSVLLTRSIKKSLLGYEPEKIAELYLKNEEILDMLEEGIIALDSGGNEAYSNLAARQLLARSFSGEVSDAIEEFVRYLKGRMTSKYNGQGGELHMSGGTILVSALPHEGVDKHGGSVYLLRDKAEQQRLAEQLTGVNHIVAALRANSHEHLNKLHVILGLLNMNDTETAMRYIEQIKHEEEEDYSLVIRCIENKTIAALVLGKKRRAKERNMRINLRKDSHLDAVYEHLTDDELVTAIGNLLENAMDAVEGCDGPGEISLYLFSDENGLVIGVDDTGSGISAENLERIHSGEFTTKGEGRGIGLRLVKEIVQKYNGVMDIESDPGEGTSFTLTFYTRSE